ncbi:hypothetical protein PENTCL1PPCAC_2873, partial [Pristionchus entomophagus]
EILSKSVETEEGCKNSCYDLQECQSYGYGPRQREGKHNTCVLLPDYQCKVKGCPRREYAIMVKKPCLTTEATSPSPLPTSLPPLPESKQIPFPIGPIFE